VLVSANQYDYAYTVGVSSTITRDKAEGIVRSSGDIKWTSCNFTTPRDSSDVGCSGSDIGAIKSVKRQLFELQCDEMIGEND
jgi:hypothetical protein